MPPPTTAISFQLSDAGHTTLTIYDALGREVATLVNEIHEAGYCIAQFDGTRLSSGIYFARLQSGVNVHLIKMQLLNKECFIVRYTKDLSVAAAPHNTLCGIKCRK
jgi:hypothetical protein